MSKDWVFVIFMAFFTSFFEFGICYINEGIYEGIDVGREIGWVGNRWS
jgi:hypothetical protein